MAKLVFVLFFALCASSYARTPFRANQYIDTVLYSNLRNAARYANVDPAQIANFTIHYTDKGVFTKTSVKIDYYLGNVTGLLDVQRIGNCSPVIRMYGNDTLNCTIAFRNVKIAYRGRMVHGKSSPVNINVQADMSQTNAFVEVTTTTWRNYPVLKSLRLVNIGTIKPKHTGSSSSKKNEQRDSAFAGLAYNEFSKVFNYNFIPSLGRALSTVQMPVA